MNKKLIWNWDMVLGIKKIECIMNNEWIIERIKNEYGLNVI